MFDKHGVGAISPLGQRYLDGQLRQATLAGDFQLSRQGDIPELGRMTPEEYGDLQKAGWTAAPGRVAFCVLAAGASSRMDLKRIPRASGRC